MDDNKFLTIEEYIEDCIQTNSSCGRISSMPVKIRVEEDIICFDGDLLIDGNKVIPNLNWSTVKARSAKIIHNAVNDYRKLPQCLNGLRGDASLPQPPDIKCFLDKNAAGRFYEEHGRYHVTGNLTLFDFPALDLSTVNVQKCLLIRSDDPVEFVRLPKAGKIMGLNPKNIILPEGRIIGFKELKQKGLGGNACRKLSGGEPKMLEKLIAGVKSTLGF